MFLRLVFLSVQMEMRSLLSLFSALRDYPGEEISDESREVKEEEEQEEVEEEVD